jgi:uncharacterized membrane protein
MKRINAMIYFLMFLELTVSAIGISILPDVMPVHYNFFGEVNRFGSKYELLVILAISLIFSAVMILYTKNEKNKEVGNQKVFSLINICFLIFFNIINAYFIYIGYINSSNQGSANPDNSMQIISIVMAVLFSFMGYLMPKVKRNHVFGVRTIWSMKNDEVWKKSQYFSGIAMIIGGVLSIIGSIILPKAIVFIFMFSIIIIISVVSVFASYIIWRKYNETKSDN